MLSELNTRGALKGGSFYLHRAETARGRICEREQTFYRAEHDCPYSGGLQRALRERAAGGVALGAGSPSALSQVDSSRGTMHMAYWTAVLVCKHSRCVYRPHVSYMKKAENMLK